MKTCVCCGEPTMKNGNYNKYCDSCSDISKKIKARVRRELKSQMLITFNDRDQLENVQYLIKSLKVSLHILEEKKYLTPEIIEKALYYYNDFIDGEL